jgi:hypothetical protein
MLGCGRLGRRASVGGLVGGGVHIGKGRLS